MLVEHLISSPELSAIISEMPYMFSSKRADLVTLDENNVTSVYEIKSGVDTTNRLNYQSESYKRYYDFCYVVCERINLNQIRTLIPSKFGILCVEDGKIVKIRKASQYRALDKIALLSTMSISELRGLVSIKDRKSKFELCQVAASELSLDRIKAISRESLLKKNEKQMKLLRMDVSQKITADDLHTITKRPPSAITSS